MSVKLNHEPKQVLIDLTGIDGLLAIKRHLQIPTHLITGVEALDRKAIPPVTAPGCGHPAPISPAWSDTGHTAGLLIGSSGQSFARNGCWSSRSAIGTTPG